MNGLITSTIGNGSGYNEKETLVKLIKDIVDERTIKHQIDLLISMDCIFLLNDDEIVLSEVDKNPKSIVKLFEDVAVEALKFLKDSRKKTMTYLVA